MTIPYVRSMRTTTLELKAICLVGIHKDAPYLCPRKAAGGRANIQHPPSNSSGVCLGVTARSYETLKSLVCSFLYVTNCRPNYCTALRFNEHLVLLMNMSCEQRIGKCRLVIADLCTPRLSRKYWNNRRSNNDLSANLFYQQTWSLDLATELQWA